MFKPANIAHTLFALCLPISLFLGGNALADSNESNPVTAYSLVAGYQCPTPTLNVQSLPRDALKVMFVNLSKDSSEYASYMSLPLKAEANDEGIQNFERLLFLDPNDGLNSPLGQKDDYYNDPVGDAYKKQGIIVRRYELYNVSINPNEFVLHISKVILNDVSLTPNSTFNTATTKVIYDCLYKKQ